MTNLDGAYEDASTVDDAGQPIAATSAKTAKADKNAYATNKTMIFNLENPDDQNKILEAIETILDEQAAEGIGFFMPKDFDIEALPKIGHVGFTPKTIKDRRGDAMVAAVAAIYIPSLNDFVTKAEGPLRVLVTNAVMSLMTSEVRKNINISEDGSITLSKEITSDAFAMIAPKPTGIAKDHLAPFFVKLALQFAGRTQAGKSIEAKDMRSCLASAHFAQSSAFSALEAPSKDFPKGLFVEILLKMEKVVTSFDEKKLAEFATHLQPKQAITAAYINELKSSNWPRTMIVKRLETVLKAQKAKASPVDQFMETALAGII